MDEKRVPGASSPKQPGREATILGVGVSEEQAPAVAPAAPIVAVVPSREATVLGVGTTPAPERSLAVDLVVKKPSPALAESEPPREEEPAPSRRRRWPAFLLLAAALGCAGYALRDRLPIATLRAFVAAHVPAR
jgi:hypothetical protein